MRGSLTWKPETQAFFIPFSLKVDASTRVATAGVNVETLHLTGNPASIRSHICEFYVKHFEIHRVLFNLSHAADEKGLAHKERIQNHKHPAV